MFDNTLNAKASAEVKDFLLQEHRHLSDSLWKNEQTGETRANLFIGLVTLVVMALAALIKDGKLQGEPLRLFVAVSLFALLGLGIITLKRMMTRNEATDTCKRALDSVRQIIKDHFDNAHILLQYYPFGGPKKKPRRRGFGGMTYTIAAINSLLAALLLGVVVYPIPIREVGVEPATKQDLTILWILAGTTLVVAFIAQCLFLACDKKKPKKKKEEKKKPAFSIELPYRYSHAGGVVYTVKEGVTKYLLIRSSDKKHWVLPKGHIEDGEDHAETALREVREEAGIVARPICLIGSAIYKTPGEDVNAKYYLMEEQYDENARENRKSEWFTLEEALGMSEFSNMQCLIREGDKMRKRLSKGVSQTQS